MAESGSSESQYIQKFLQEIRNLDDLPCQLDSTVVEQIIEQVTADEANVTAVTSIGAQLDVGSSGFACTFCLKLFTKFLKQNSGLLDVKIVGNFVQRCICCFCEADLCDYSLLCAIFQLLCVFVSQDDQVFLHQSAAVLATTCLQADKMSIFVKKAAAKYLKTAFSGNRISIDSAVLVSVLIDSDDLLVECVAEILMELGDEISDGSAKELCSAACSRRCAGPTFTRLLALLFMRNKENRDVFKSQRWRSQRLKLQVLRCMITEGCTELMPALLSEPELQLADIVPCIPQLSDKDRETLLRNWISDLGDPRKCPTEDVISFLSLPDVFELYDSVQTALSERFWKSPELLALMVKTNEAWALKKRPDLIHYAIQGLSSQKWEDRDAAVEFVRLFTDLDPCEFDEVCGQLCRLAADDENHFVRANSLRFLGERQVDAVLSVAADALKSELYSDPRLEAAVVLLENFPRSLSYCTDILPTVLEDSDPEIRRVAISIASKMITLGGEIESLAKQHLIRCREEESAWRKDIDAVLGPAATSDAAAAKGDDAVALLKEALQKLSLPDDAPSEFVMDCY